MYVVTVDTCNEQQQINNKQLRSNRNYAHLFENFWQKDSGMDNWNFDENSSIWDDVLKTCKHSTMIPVFQGMFLLTPHHIVTYQDDGKLFTCLQRLVQVLTINLQLGYLVCKYLVRVSH